MKTWGVWAVCENYDEGLPVYLGEVFVEHRAQAKKMARDLDGWKNIIANAMRPLKWKIVAGYPKKEAK